MRQLPRWYNVDITDQSGGKYNDKILGGRISRNLRLEDVLRVLKHYDIQCRLEHNNIILLP